MDFTEKEIEDLLYDLLKKGDVELLYDKGISEAKKYLFLKKQVDLNHYGRLDILGISYIPRPNYCKKILEIGIFEIKKGEINKETLFQAIRYCKGIENYFKFHKIKFDLKFEIFLIGKSICQSEFCYISDIIPNIYCYTFDIDFINGITFNKEENYYLTDINFPLHKKIHTSVGEMIKNEIRSQVNYVFPL